MKKYLLSGLLLILLSTPCFATIWYVDNTATGSNNGTSWPNAWPSLAAIAWGGAGVVAGDTLYISGGEVSKTYSERLVIGASGSVEAGVITIQVGQDSGHNGVVILDGSSLSYAGINISNDTYVNISGQVGAGTGQNIKVQNFYYSGISVSGDSSNIGLSYIEVTENSRIGISGSFGLLLNATEISTGVLLDIHHCKFHNNNYADEVDLVQGYLGTRTTYDQIKFHDNEIYDAHADFMKVSAEGTSVYNNTFHSRGNHKSDHPDGIQFYGGYVKIYNNTFYGFHRDDDNSVNSYIRYNPDTAAGRNGNPAYVWIYNNLFYETLPLTFASASVVTHGGLTYTCIGSHYSNASREPGTGDSWETYWSQRGTGGTPWALNTTYNDPTEARRGIELSPQPDTTLNHVYVMNNTMVGTNFFGLFLGFKVSHTTARVSDIIIANNIFYDCSMTTTSGYGGGTVFLTGSNGDGSVTYGKWGDDVDVIIDYNTVYASSADWVTNSYFLDTTYIWADFKTNSGTSASPANATQNPLLTVDFYLLSSDSPYKESGVDLSAYFTTDKDGVVRPEGSAWALGAYQTAASNGEQKLVTPLTEGNGLISPEFTEYVISGEDSSTYTATPDNGWKISAWSGTCGATGSASTYQKTNVTEACTIIVTFAPQYLFN